MQIHEVTKQPLKEGLLDAFQSPDKMAAQAAEKLRAQGYGQEKPPLQPDQAIDSVQKNTAQQQYIKGLVAQWQKDAPKVEPAVSKPSADQTPASKSVVKPAPGATVAPTPTITIGSVGKLTKGDGGYWYNEKGQPVTDPAQAAKIDKAFKDQEYRKAQTKMTAMVREAPEEYTTPGGIVVPGSTKTDKSTSATTAPASTAYRSAFEDWATKKILTKEPVTRETITLDAVKNSPIGSQLEQALNQVVATAGDPQKNAAAVNNYLTMAVAGVVMKTQELRSKQTTGASAARAGQGIVTQQEIRDQLKQQVGLSATQLDALKKLGSDPAARQAMLKMFGVT